MVLKLLVFMVAVAVLKGVAGLQEEQFANETQIEANPDHKKRGRRLDKLPCIMEQGTCQRIGDACDGVVRGGAEWCLHHRHFECCYPKHCVLNGAVCPNGTVAVQSCIELICKNGCWVNQGRSPHCCPCSTYGETDIDPYEINPYSMIGNSGLYKFSWYNGDYLPRFGINILLVLGGTCITAASYTEGGVTVVIWFNPSFPGSYTVTVSTESDSGVPFSAGPSSKAHQLPIFVPPVYISCDKRSIFIIGNSGITMHVTWDSANPKCAENVHAYADESVFGNLNGLCANITEDCHSRNVNATQAFIDSWKERSLRKTRLRNNQAIIESSMSEIENSCEELNYGPCIIPSSEECEKMKEDCVSRMKNAIKPGQESFSDSTE